MSSADQSRDIAGRYQLREALAKRPVGRWFRAFDREVDVDVGLLLVNPELLPDEASQNRFMGAVVEMRGINHRHLLRLFDVGREGDSVYLTTQMTQPIRALYKAEGVLDYVSSVADGLDAVHRAGQTHGRLTPSDIGEVQKLIKVSGAGLYSDVPPAVAMRVWRGLSCFWAPEVVRGERPTPAADVYSLAAIAVVLLSSGKTADPHRALEGLKQENRQVYDALAPAMAVTPDDRPASPSLLVNRLSNALDEEEVDEQETTYFVKGSLDELTKDVGKPSPVGGESKSSGSAETTVLDVHVPPEVAQAQAPRPAGKRSRIAELVGDAKKAKRAELAERAQKAKQANLAKKAEERSKGKKRPSPSHDRTVVDRTTLPKGAAGPERKVPAMVAMGPPVGPSSASSSSASAGAGRSRGKDKARRDEAGVPQRLPTNDETEKMSAEHMPGAFATLSSKKKLPPAVAASSWVTHASKPAIPVRKKPQTARQTDQQTGPQAGQQPGQSEVSGADPAPVATRARSSEPSGGDSRSTRRPASQPASRPASEPAMAISQRPVIPSLKATDPSPVAQPPGPASISPVPASISPASAVAQEVPAPPRPQTPRPQTPQPLAAQPLVAQQQPQPPPFHQQTLQPGNTHQVPRPASNMTWVYLVLAAIASATLAILVAMALFGD